MGCPWSTSGFRRSAFSLVELLAVITVIAVLISLTLPALRGVREKGGELRCQAVLAGLSAGVSVWARDHQDIWPNLFADQMNEAFLTFDAGRITYETSYWGQVRLWMGPLIGIVWEEGDPVSLWTCPSVMRDGYGLGGGVDQLTGQPADGALVSYYYSAALLSRWTLWEGDPPHERPDIEAFRRRVFIHDVRHPSQKVVFSEVMSFHGQAVRFAWENDSGPLNILGADGHVQALTSRHIVPPVPTRSMFDASGEVRPVPFVGTPRGSEGMDIAP